MLASLSLPPNGLGLIVTEGTILPLENALDLLVVHGVLLGSASAFLLAILLWHRGPKRGPGGFAILSLPLLLGFSATQIHQVSNSLHRGICIRWLNRTCLMQSIEECGFPTIYYDACPIKSSFDISDGLPASYKVLYATQGILVLVNDGLLAHWVAGWVVPGGNRVLPILWIGLVVIWVLGLVSHIMSVPGLESVSSFAFLCCSLLCNIFGISCSGVKLRKFEATERMSSPSYGQLISRMAVVSGILYLTVQIAYLTALCLLSTERSGTGKSELAPGALYVVQAAYTGLMGLYPAIMRALVGFFFRGFNRRARDCVAEARQGADD